MYDQGVESPGHEFKNSLIDQEYGINTNPNSPRNLQANARTERIYQVLGNLILTFNLHDTYVDDSFPWMRILVTAAFTVRSTCHQTKQKNPGQSVYGQDTIIQINHLTN